MCRDEHEQIGHGNSENEMCPLCIALADLAKMKAVCDAAKKISRKQMLLVKHQGIDPLDDVRELAEALTQLNNGGN
jgi:hypothetical protein